MAISEFAVSSASTNSWAKVTTSVVGGSTKYGIYVTNANSPRYTLLNANFYPYSAAGSTVIVELYANTEGQGAGDPNTVSNVYDGVALTNVAGSSIPATSISSSSNTAIYGVGSSTKVANYVYNFSNNGYADTKKMAIGGNKKRRVFAIRSWGELNANYNKPYIAFIGDSGALNYNGTTTGYSVGCVGATRPTTAAASANTWISHTAGDGTKYYSITNTTTGANVYAGITLTRYHTYRFTLHAHTEASFDGVAICKTTTDTAFNSLKASDLISGNVTTGKCSGKDKTTTFEYVATSGGQVYIYFKSDSSGIGPGDGKSFGDVMVEDLGDLRSNQGTPTAADVTVEYEETATASASGGGTPSGPQGTVQYRTQNPTTLAWNPWTTTAPTQTAVGTIKYQAIYTGNASYKPSAVSNTATLTVIPRKIIKPTAKTGLVYNGNMQDGVNPLRYANEPASPSRAIVEVSGTTSGKNAGNYSATYSIVNSNYCWVDMTTAPVTVNWSIAQLEAALKWGTTTWLYDGNSHSTTCRVSNIIKIQTSSGFIYDSCMVSLSGNSITEIGSALVTATALSNSNYKLPSSKTTILTIKPCMHIKSGDTWVPVIQAYKKENGVWVRQTTTIGSLFSTSEKYLGRYPDPKTGEWKNLIDG